MSENTRDGVKEGTWLRILIVAFPVGLLVLGTLSMFLSHFRNRNVEIDPNEKIRLESASLNRRPVDQADLEASLLTLEQKVGKRSPSDPEALERAAFWIESTLGGGNIGYTVTRHAFESGGREFRNLIAELPGRERREEIILVAVPYDTDAREGERGDSDAGIAALLAMARAFAGNPQARTVRWMAFVNEGAEGAANGKELYIKHRLARGEKITAVLLVERVGGFEDEAGVFFRGDESSRYYVDSAAGAFTRGSSLPSETAILAEAASEDPVISRIPEVRVEGGDLLSKSKAGEDREASLKGLAEFTRGLEAVVNVWANP